VNKTLKRPTTVIAIIARVRVFCMAYHFLPGVGW
jgi:hypothetical protein